MSYLLDTHVLLWFTQAPEKIGKVAYRRIANSDEPKYFSIVSLWEIGIKFSLGKLQLNSNIQSFAQEQRQNAFHLLPLDLGHIEQLIKLPLHHRDLFDRMLVAQALSENLTIITADENFKKYRGLKRVW